MKKKQFLVFAQSALNINVSVDSGDLHFFITSGRFILVVEVWKAQNHRHSATTMGSNADICSYFGVLKPNKYRKPMFCFGKSSFYFKKSFCFFFQPVVFAKILDISGQDFETLRILFSQSGFWKKISLMSVPNYLSIVWRLSHLELARSVEIFSAQSYKMLLKSSTNRPTHS